MSKSEQKTYEKKEILAILKDDLQRVLTAGHINRDQYKNVAKGSFADLHALGRPVTHAEITAGVMNKCLTLLKDELSPEAQVFMKEEEASAKLEASGAGSAAIGATSTATDATAPARPIAAAGRKLAKPINVSDLKAHMKKAREELSATLAQREASQQEEMQKPVSVIVTVVDVAGSSSNAKRQTNDPKVIGDGAQAAADSAITLVKKILSTADELANVEMKAPVGTVHGSEDKPADSDAASTVSSSSTFLGEVVINVANRRMGIVVQTLINKSEHGKAVTARVGPIPFAQQLELTQNDADKAARTHYERQQQQQEGLLAEPTMPPVAATSSSTVGQKRPREQQQFAAAAEDDLYGGISDSVFTAAPPVAAPVAAAPAAPPPMTREEFERLRQKQQQHHPGPSSGAGGGGLLATPESGGSLLPAPSGNNNQQQRQQQQEGGTWGKL